MNAQDLLSNLTALNRATTERGRLVAATKQLWLVLTFWNDIESSVGGQSRIQRAKKLQDSLSSLFFRSGARPSESWLSDTLPFRSAVFEIRNAIECLKKLTQKD